MPKPSLFLALSAVLLTSSSGACEFTTAGVPKDGGVIDADDERDAQDVDPDGTILDDAVIADAEIQADTGVTQCGEVAGICTADLDTICPVGTRPYGDDESLDCPGHCCVTDPSSTCNSNDETNCSMADECVGCWAPAQDTALSCDSGRLCCEWTCGG